MTGTDRACRKVNKYGSGSGRGIFIFLLQRVTVCYFFEKHSLSCTSNYAKIFSQRQLHSPMSGKETETFPDDTYFLY
ncbi:unnamed protein product [Amoebophrya sp. A120]|nr:unnamed protein product [Amoebophrya sp. A120]|eukprot:GSA120T00013608001.1